MTRLKIPLLCAVAAGGLAIPVGAQEVTLTLPGVAYTWHTTDEGAFQLNQPAAPQSALTFATPGDDEQGLPPGFDPCSLGPVSPLCPEPSNTPEPAPGDRLLK